MGRWQHRGGRLLSVGLCCALAVTSYAADHYVSAGGSIQAAVDLAGDGDTVILAAGTYNLTAGVNFGYKYVIVRSESGRDVTIVDGGGTVRCFYMVHTLAKVEGLTIRNGKAPASGNGLTYGGGVHCEGGGQVVDCIVENCTANLGGGIRLSSNGLVEDCIIRNNTATLYHGGGIQVHVPNGNVSDCTISGCSIYGNTAADEGGGVKLSLGGEVFGCAIYSNTAGYGGGLYAESGGHVVECEVYGNSAAYGGGIRLQGIAGTPEARQCDIHDNTTTTGNGGGVHIYTAGLLENSLVYDNLAGVNGGGIYLYNGGEVHSCTVAHNTTKNTDGVGGGDGLGGGVYARDGGTIRNSVIFWNTSEVSPNIYTDGTGVSYEYCLTHPEPEGNGNFFTLPNFVDKDARNYYLQMGSSCIDNGGSSGAPTEDFTGYRRPLDGKDDGIVSQKYDIGAYEYKDTDDADGDGLPTYWELLYGLDPASSNDLDGASGDFDADLLTNLEEYNNGSHPNDPDTDDDGLSDSEEVYPATGPATDPANADTDSDGFDDKYEIDNDSDPTDANSYLTSLSGTITYSGSVQSVPVVVLVSNATIAVRTTTILGVGAYTVANVPTLEAFMVTAYQDSNSDGTNQPWEAYGEYVSNPLTLNGSATGINIALSDPTTDSDGDGLSDFFEVYTSMTDPNDKDSDGDSMWDGWEWTYRPFVNPTNGLDGVLDPDNDGLTNTFEFVVRSNPGTNDTDGDTLPDEWEWRYQPATHPTNGLDGSEDPDGDTLSNSNEYAFGSNPNLPDTDFDGMPDEWEVLYIPSLNPASNDANEVGVDYDLLSNIDEYNAGSNPTNPDSDSDSMIDGWEYHYTNVCNLVDGTDGTNDPDGDGLTNFEEYDWWATYGVQPWGPHPDVADSDGDGVNDGDEVAVGSDPTNPDSFPVSISGTVAPYFGIQTGVVYAVASQSPSGQVYRSSAITNVLTNATPYVIPNVAIFTNYTVRAFLDSNGNASQDVWEATGTYNGAGSNPVLIYLTNAFANADITLVDDLLLDSDGDTLSDLDEVYVYGTDPLLIDTDGDSMPDWWEILYTNACDPNDPLDWNDDVETDLGFVGDGLNNSNEYQNLTNPEVSDTDGDGITDYDEINQTDPTDPTDADSDNDGLNDGEEDSLGTDPNDPDSDIPVGDGVNDGDEVAAGTDPLDPASFPTSISGELIYTNGLGGTLYAIAIAGTNAWTNAIAAPGGYAITNLPTLTNYTVLAYLDTNTNGVRDTWEAEGSYTNGGGAIWLTNAVTSINILLEHPTTDTDGDGLSDYIEVNVYLTNPNTNDSDGDSMLDGWEVLYTNALNPNVADGSDDYAGESPSPDGLVNSNEHVWNTSPELWDTDGDSMPDDWEVMFSYAVNPTNGTDGAEDYAGETNAFGVIMNDFLVNSNEYLWGTDPGLWDTDGDGVSDGDEVAAGSNPTNSASYLISISGSVSYTGSQTGPVYALVAFAGGTHTNLITPFGVSGSYVFSNLDTLEDYTIRAFRDSNTNGMLDIWEADGSYSNNVISQPSNDVLNVDIFMSNPTSDTDGDGLLDYDEVYTYGTSPSTNDTDGDTMLDGWEIGWELVYGNTNVVNARFYDATNDFDSDGLINSNEFDALADPGNPDSDADSMPDGWEYSYPTAVNPTNGLDATSSPLDITTDPDGDKLSNSNEFIWGTSPELWDTDGDSMPDGWEVQYSNAVNPTNSADGIIDNPNETNAFGGIERDGLSNSNEFLWGTNPELWDTDGDSMPDGWEVLYSNAVNPTNGADGIIDNPNETNAVGDIARDGLSNSNEYIWGTNPELWDTDGDSMPDGWEVQYSNAVNPTNSADGIIDNPNETNAFGLIERDGLSNSNEFLWGTNPDVFDTDGDGAGDGLEVNSGTDPTNATSKPISISGQLWNWTSPTLTGEVYVVLSLASNSNVFARYDIGQIGGFVIPYAVTNVPSRSNYWVSAFIDINSNTTYETWEPFGAFTNATPADNNASNVVVGVFDSFLDSDNDGLTDYDEVYTYFTSPTNSDTDADGFNDSNEVSRVYTTDPNDILSFPARIGGDITYGGVLTNYPVWVVVSNAALTESHGPFTVGPYTTPTNCPTLTNYFVSAYIDENTNGVLDLWEPRGVTETYPLDLTADVGDAHIVLMDPSGDTDGDGLSDYAENYRYFTDPTTNDTDGDLMLDGWEVLYTNACVATNADGGVDYDLDGLTNLEEHDLVPQTDPENADSDDDGLTDGAEVNTHLTEPTNADTDGDGMPDGWEVQYISMLDPLTPDPYEDPDGDGLWNLREYEDSLTDPTDPDTDAEGLTDYEEYVTYHTNPTNADTDVDGFTDYEEVIEIGSMATNLLDPRVVDDDAPDDVANGGSGDSNISDPEEAGTKAHPYDSIQEGIDTAEDGYTVLVLDGTYTGTKNFDIDPQGRAIVIRSRNGYGSTRIENGFGGGFICNSGEGTNTVIRGFTILTSTALNGDAGIDCDGTSPTILECYFNDCGHAGVYCRNGAEPNIQESVFEYNEGAIKIVSSDPIVERCTIRLNHDANGAGLWITGTSTPQIINCVITQNTADNDGAGVYVAAESEPVFMNCTIADNVASNRGGGIYIEGTMYFGNGVLWGNSASVNDGWSLQDEGQLNAEYCCMQTFHPNTGNKHANPRFVALGDYSLQSSSPCVDEGSGNPLGIAAPTDDRDGNDRRITVGGHSIYDMGAYEYLSGGRVSIQSPGGTDLETLTASLPTIVEWTWEDAVGTNLTLEFTYDYFETSPTWYPIASNVFRGTNGMGSYTWNVPQANVSQCYLRVSDSTNSLIKDDSSFGFSITNGIRLFEPNGGEQFYIGQTADVSWASSAATNITVDLVLSVDGGATFDVLGGAVSVASSVVHTNGGVTNSTTWVIPTDDPNVLTANGRMRVAYEYASLSDASDESFEILGLVVTQPGDGGASSVSTGGAPVTVEWYTVGAGAAVDISLSTNAGTSYVVLTNGQVSVDGSNTYSWTVGNTPTSNALLRITSLSDSNVVGVSGSFKITDGITVTGVPDLDGDGMSDDYETLSGLDYQSGSGVDGPDGDPDGDGFVNLSEMLAGTDPQNGDSWIGIRSMGLQFVSGLQPDADSVRVPTIRISTVPGHDYRIESAPSVTGTWGSASDILHAGSEEDEMTWEDRSGDPPPLFYRIIVIE